MWVGSFTNYHLVRKRRPRAEYLFVGRPRLQMFSCHNYGRHVLRNMPTKIYFIKKCFSRRAERMWQTCLLSLTEVLNEREKCFFRFLFTSAQQETVPFLYLILKLALRLKLCRHTQTQKRFARTSFLFFPFPLVVVVVVVVVVVSFGKELSHFLIQSQTWQKAKKISISETRLGFVTSFCE